MTKDFTAKDVLNFDFHSLFPPIEDESRLLLGCRKADYTASAIARAVEDCNAQLLNLNVTSLPCDSAEVIVAVRVNLRNAEPIARSLMRYGYDVIDVDDSHDGLNDSMRDRANEVLRYLNI